MGPSLPDVPPTGEASADGEPKANLPVNTAGGGRLNLPPLGDKVAGPGVAPRFKPTQQGPHDPREMLDLGFENDGL